MATPAEIYYTTFKGNTVELYNGNKSLIRRFNLKSEVVNAQVTGTGKNAYIAIVTKDGRSYLYRSDGALIRW